MAVCQVVLSDREKDKQSPSTGVRLGVRLGTASLKGLLGEDLKAGRDLAMRRSGGSRQQSLCGGWKPEHATVFRGWPGAVWRRQWPRWEQRASV